LDKKVTIKGSKWMAVSVFALLPFFSFAQPGGWEKKMNALEKQINVLQRKQELYRKKMDALADSASKINDKIEALKAEKARLQAPPVIEAPPPPPAPMVPEDPEDRIFSKVEIDARFRGGADSLLAQLNRYYTGKQLPQDDEIRFMLQLLISREGKPRTCTLFKESKSGVYRQIGLGGFMLGTQWYPARQNGEDVNAYFFLNLTLKKGRFVPWVPEKQ
jgi:hypothetical protein